MMSSLKRVLVLLLFPCLSSAIIKTKEGDELTNLGRDGDNTIDLMFDGAEAFLYVRLCPWTLYTEDNKGNKDWILNMTRYCYCTSSTSDDLKNTTCSFPGPTLLMHSYTNVKLTLVNELVGTTCTYGPYSTDCPTPAPIADANSIETSSVQQTKYWNHYKDMDTTNLHVHGLHVSPFVDDIIFANVGPIPLEDKKVTPQQHAYNYSIDFHYPGTFWYHAHHHGSTTWQVNMGLHGAILMNPWDDMKYPADESLYKGKRYEIGKYTQHVLMFEWLYAIDKDWCTNVDWNHNGKLCHKDNNFTYEAMFTAFPDHPSTIDKHGGAIDDWTMCDVWCSFPPYQRAKSLYSYDVKVNDKISQCKLSGKYDKGKKLDPTKNVFKDCMFFLVNGQYKPKILNVPIGEYQRLRLINSMSNWYMQMAFPDSCKWYLIATDGIYITEDDILNYDLNITHKNRLLMAPGGRADVLFNCIYSGNHTITSSRATDIDKDQMPHIAPIAYSGAPLFSIVVEGDDTVNPTSSPTHEPTGPTTAPIGTRRPTPHPTPAPTFSPTVSPTTPTQAPIPQPTPDSLPKKGDYPPKPKGTYIESFCSSEIQSDTSCKFDETGECEFGMYFDPTYKRMRVDGPATNFKGVSFNTLPGSFNFVELVRNLSLGFMKGDPENNGTGQKIIINNGRLAHVYHQHINPFQVMEKVGNEGFFALKCTWWDSLGNYGGERGQKNNIIAKTWTRGHWLASDSQKQHPIIDELEDRFFGQGGGLIIIHCHLLQHEDKGMMGFYGIVNRKLFAESDSVVSPVIDVDPLELSVWQQWYSWYQLHYLQLMVILSAVLSILCASMLCGLMRNKVPKQKTKYAAVKAVSDTEGDDIEIQPIIN